MNAVKMFLALDLELNNAKDGSTKNPKIIQVGVAWGSWDHYVDNSIQTKKWYIDPEEPIYPEITQLTGITDNDIKEHSVSHQVVAEELSEIITTNATFVNPVTWGGGDTTELLNEFHDRDIKFPHFGRRWIDVKTWHLLYMLSQDKSITGGLKGSMSRHGIQFQGTAHRADIDAYNTLRLFFKILDHQDRINYLLKIAKNT
jgi:inhibitor of KinA sporulation pathway (predicted exonuclease)